ncbi:MAG: hypothetical protein ACRCUS_00965 [Anaerovoracaceae bacterium]
MWKIKLLHALESYLADKKDTACLKGMVKIDAKADKYEEIYSSSLASLEKQETEMRKALEEFIANRPTMEFDLAAVHEKNISKLNEQTKKYELYFGN